jgi:surface protein
MQGTKRPARFVQQSNVVGRVRNGPKATSNGRPLKSARVVKITHKDGGFTVVATPGSRIGDSGGIDGIRYVIRTKSQLKDLIAKRRWRDVERTCTSKITDMSFLFRDAFDIRADISHWDVGNVTNMTGMFRGATLFNGDISNWNVSRVEDMSKMFMGATSFNGDISRWNVSRVEDMNRMFWGATSFNGDISRWDVREVTDMYDMFGNTPSFNRSILAWKPRLHGGLSIDNETMARILRGGRRPPGIKYKTRSGVEVRIRKYRGKDNMYRAWSILRGFYMPDCIKPRFADPTWTVFIAMGRGDEIYGALWLVEKKDTVYIKSLSVAKKAREKGIGHLMIARAVRHAREVRKKTIELESLTTPETLKFYNRLGFVRGPPQLRQRAKRERWTMFTPVMNDVNGMDMDLPRAHLRTRNFNGSKTGPVRKQRVVKGSNSKKRGPTASTQSNKNPKTPRVVNTPMASSAKRHKGLS